MKTNNMMAAWHRGWHSRHDGNGLSSNPYFNAELRLAFETGWVDRNGAGPHRVTKLGTLSGAFYYAMKERS